MELGCGSALANNILPWMVWGHALATHPAGLAMRESVVWPPQEDFWNCGSPVQGEGADRCPGNHCGRTTVSQMQRESITHLHTGDAQRQSRHLES